MPDDFNIPGWDVPLAPTAAWTTPETPGGLTDQAPPLPLPLPLPLPPGGFVEQTVARGDPLLGTVEAGVAYVEAHLGAHDAFGRAVQGVIRDTFVQMGREMGKAAAERILHAGLFESSDAAEPAEPARLRLTFEPGVRVEAAPGAAVAIEEHDEVEGWCPVFTDGPLVVERVARGPDGRTVLELVEAEDE
jgi:hypothetical protein